MHNITECTNVLHNNMYLYIIMYHSILCSRQATLLILVRPKDPVPAHLKNGIVYKVPCKVCSKAYVGQSGRSLECRLPSDRLGDSTCSGLLQVLICQVHAGIMAHPPTCWTIEQEQGPLPNIRILFTFFLTCPFSSYLRS